MSNALRILIASAVFLAGMPAFAHHAFASEYDMSKPVTLKGVVTKVTWENPHVWFFVDVKDQNTGAVQRWAFEAGTPSGMIRNGFKASEFKAGTPVTIKGFHARDASQNAGMVQQVIMEGKTYGLFGPQEGPAGAR